jgi:hypothetical protein
VPIWELDVERGEGGGDEGRKMLKIETTEGEKLSLFQLLFDYG